MNACHCNEGETEAGDNLRRGIELFGCLSAWMKRAVHFLQIFAVDMRVDLSSGDVSMAEHFLYSTEIGAAF